MDLFSWFHCLVCNVSLSDNEAYGGHLEMGEVVLVEMIIIGTPVHFILFPGVSLRCKYVDLLRNY